MNHHVGRRMHNRYARSNFRRGHGVSRVIHPKGWPNRPQDKLSRAEYKIDDAKDAVEAAYILLSKEEGLSSIKDVIEVAREILREKDTNSIGPVPKCSFCDEEGATYMFAVGACAVHRKAYIEGKLGANACISLEEHQIVEELREFVQKHDGKFRTEIFYPDQRPKKMPKGKVMN